MPDQNDLIDHARIADADEKLQTAAARQAAAENAFVEAQHALKAAQEASTRAVEGKGDLSPLEAEEALDQVDRTARVALKVRDAAAAAHRQAIESQRTAVAIAHAPMYLAGARGRIAAAAKAERARALFEEADADHLAATELQARAIRNGHPNLTARNGGGPRMLTTEAQEAKIWRDADVDLEAGTYPWLQQFAKPEVQS